MRIFLPHDHIFPAFLENSSNIWRLHSWLDYIYSNTQLEKQNENEIQKKFEDGYQCIRRVWIICSSYLHTFLSKYDRCEWREVSLFKNRCWLILQKGTELKQPSQPFPMCCSPLIPSRLLGTSEFQAYQCCAVADIRLNLSAAALDCSNRAHLCNYFSWLLN